MTKSKFNDRITVYRKGVLSSLLVSLLFIIPQCEKDGSITPSNTNGPTTQSTAATAKPVVTTPQAKSATVTTYQTGQLFGGGIIFYIDATGQHGLIADINDTNYRMLKWGDSYYLNTGATGTAVGTGAANTKKIIAVQGTSYNYAALVCANYRGGGFADWFLPSKDELYLLYKAKIAGIVKGFTWGAYWSSSEFFVPSYPKQQAYAWFKIFYSETAYYGLKDRVNGVRAIRAF